MKPSAPEPEPVPGSAGPLDIAMDAERRDPAPDSPARRLLLTQNRLVEKQCALADNERFRARIKAVRDAGLAVLIGAVLAGLGAAVWSAARDRSLVVQAFSVPPDLAARGATGEVLATQMMDQLAELQARTDSSRPADSYANDWSGGLEVEIPQTGVSLEEGLRLLRRSLGRQTVVTGEAVRSPDGRLHLTVRSGSGGAATVSGADDELPRMLAASAEAVYCQTQPYRCSALLTYSPATGLRPTPEQLQKGTAILRRLTTSADRTERAWAWVGLGVVEFESGDLEGSAAASRRAAVLNPNLMGDVNAGSTEAALGRPERALRHYERVARQRWEVTPVKGELTRLNYRGERARLAADFGEVLVAYRRVAEMPEYGGVVAVAPIRQGETLARLHEPSRAAALLEQAGVRDEVEAFRRLDYAWMVGPAWFRVHAERGHWAAARDGLLAVANMPERARPPFNTIWRNEGLPLLAEATARAGDLGRGRALAAATNPRSYEGALARAAIAELAGDRAAADRWFGEAVRQAPSLPFGYRHWGEAKLARGDEDGAIRLFREARKRGPRWADPLKFEGDALARRGDHSAALRRYEAALERAPRWGAAHLAAGRSLAALRRPERAAEAYRRALRLDLNAADRAEASRRLSRQAV